MTHARVTLAGAVLFSSIAFGLGAPLAASGAHDVCPASNPPNMLVIENGSSQTAPVGKAFQMNLQVALANSNGCPLTGLLGGISIDFVAPSSGASGTFASSGSNDAVVGTDAQGVAVAPPFTANGVEGSYSVHAESNYGLVKLYLTNTARGVARSVVATDQSEQSANVLARYARPLQATVLDAGGLPVKGAAVSFSLGVGSYGAGATFAGGGQQATALTDDSGLATSPPLTANGVAGPFSATASVDGVATPVVYPLHNIAVKLSFAAATRDRQTAVAGRTYKDTLKARVLDGDGRPVEGATVTFALGSSDAAAASAAAGASFASGSAQAVELTNAAGIATSPALKANTTAGRFTASATTAGARPVSFALRNLAGRPASIVAGVAANEVTRTHSRFPVRLAVTVTDANGNVVAGARVRFVAPARGPSGRFAGGRRSVPVTTNASGIAVAPVFVANGKAGGYVVFARVRGAGRSAAFALVNERR
jgi:protocatechuate 3,4-dioxygenase beta subunit